MVFESPTVEVSILEILLGFFFYCCCLMSFLSDCQLLDSKRKGSGSVFGLIRFFRGLYVLVSKGL